MGAFFWALPLAEALHSQQQAALPGCWCGPEPAVRPRSRWRSPCQPLFGEASTRQHAAEGFVSVTVCRRRPRGRDECLGNYCQLLTVWAPLFLFFCVFCPYILLDSKGVILVPNLLFFL